MNVFVVQIMEQIVDVGNVLMEERPRRVGLCNVFVELLGFRC